MPIFYLFGLIIMFTSCATNDDKALVDDLVKTSTTAAIVSNANTIQGRYVPPVGFQREGPATEFGKYLRNLKLKPSGSLVNYYDGTQKANTGIYSSVVDLPIGKKDLHQCADAIIRLRADFYYNQGKYDKISFHLTNGFLVDYSRWIEGYRVQVKGNKTTWIKKREAENSPSVYWDYLEFIFTYAGTLSLSKELKAKSAEQINIGDVFIQGGSPGHAILVVDKVINNDTGENLYLLAQSYMPAQEIQILTLPKSEDSWYSIPLGEKLITPEWIFSSSDMKQFD